MDRIKWVGQLLSDGTVLNRNCEFAISIKDIIAQFQFEMKEDVDARTIKEVFLDMAPKWFTMNTDDEFLIMTSETHMEPEYLKTIRDLLVKSVAELIKFRRMLALAERTA